MAAGVAAAALIVPAAAQASVIDTVACSRSHYSTELLFLEHPRSCIVPFSSQTFGFTVDLAHMRWRHWATRTAAAVGRESRQRVTVRAWRLRRCPGADYRVYTRVRVTSRRGVVTASFRPCATQLGQTPVP